MISEKSSARGRERISETGGKRQSPAETLAFFVHKYLIFTEGPCYTITMTASMCFFSILRSRELFLNRFCAVLIRYTI